MDFFASGSGFRRIGAPEHQNPTKTKVVTLHKYKIVLGGLNGQDPTTAGVWPASTGISYSLVKFLELEVETAPSGEPKGIL